MGKDAGLQRLVGLDLLRAMAIAFVLLAHVPFFADVSKVQIWFQLWLASGMWGVELFFALSGFLITGLLYRVFDDFSLARFRIYLIRRWMRTIPLYYVAIVVTILLEGVLIGLPIVDVERYFLFIQTIPTGTYQWFGVSWSLSIEEWSYLLFPCAIAALWFVRDMERRFALAFIGAIVVFTAYRMALGSGEMLYETFDADIRRALIPRLDALAYGGLMRVAWGRHREALAAARVRLLVISIVGQIICLQVYLLHGMQNSLAAAGLLTLLQVSLCLSLPFALTIERVPSRVYRVWHYVATRSYALYLFHVPIYVLVGKHLADTALPVRIAVALGTVFLIAEIAHRGIERPFMDRRPAEPAPGTPRRVEAAA